MRASVTHATVRDAPLAVNDDLREILIALNNAKSVTDRLKLVTKLRPGQIVPAIPRNEEPRTGLSMGGHTAKTAAEYGISRSDQDELAAASHVNLAAAYDRGFFDQSAQLWSRTGTLLASSHQIVYFKG